MRRLLACAALLLAGCASAPDEIRPVEQGALTQLLVPGQTSKTQAAALMQPARRIAFDSGYEVWLYYYRGGSGYGEYVVLFGPDGVVRKTRRREP